MNEADEEQPEPSDVEPEGHQMEIEEYPEVLPGDYIKCHDGTELIASEQTRYERMKQAETIEQMAEILQEIDTRDWIQWLKGTAGR